MTKYNYLIEKIRQLESQNEILAAQLREKQRLLDLLKLAFDDYQRAWVKYLEEKSY